MLMGCDSPSESEDKIPSNSTPVELGDAHRLRLVKSLFIYIKSV